MKQTYIRIIASVLLLAAAPLSVTSHSRCDEAGRDDRSDEEILVYNDTVESFMSENRATTLGNLTFEDIMVLNNELSVTAQQEHYVQSSRRASMIFPGAGHFMIGDSAKGMAYSLGTVLVTSGAIAGMYFLLPKDLQFGEVDYLNDSFSSIEAAWEGESLASLAPSFGIFITSMIINGILGQLSADDVERKARKQIETGAVQFVPRPFIYPDAEGRLFLGARIGL